MSNGVLAIRVSKPFLQPHISLARILSVSIIVDPIINVPFLSRVLS